MNWILGGRIKTSIYFFSIEQSSFFCRFYFSWEYTFMYKLLLFFDDTLIGRFWYIAGSSYEMVMVWIFCQQVIQISCLFSIDVFLLSMSKKFNAIEIWEYLCQGLTAWSITLWLSCGIEIFSSLKIPARIDEISPEKYRNTCVSNQELYFFPIIEYQLIHYFAIKMWSYYFVLRVSMWWFHSFFFFNSIFCFYKYSLVLWNF